MAGVASRVTRHVLDTLKVEAIGLLLRVAKHFCSILNVETDNSSAFIILVMLF